MVKNFFRRCVIIGAAPVTDSDICYIKSKVTNEDFIICADGGANILEKLDMKPDLLVGDFDSSKPHINFSVETIRLPVKKDDTDMMYSIKEGLKRGFTNFVILCGTGGRLDHTIANISSIYYLSRHGAKAVISDKFCDIFVIYEDQLVIKNKVGKTISVFQYGEDKCILSYNGLEYELNKKELKADEPIGVSNVIMSECAKITVHNGSALIIVLNQ